MSVHEAIRTDQAQMETEEANKQIQKVKNNEEKETRKYNKTGKENKSNE
jgi:hypothetical protein